MAAASCPNWLLLKKRSLLDSRNAHVRKSCGGHTCAHGNSNEHNNIRSGAGGARTL
jgi:hypothetical protein